MATQTVNQPQVLHGPLQWRGVVFGDGAEPDFHAIRDDGGETRLIAGRDLMAPDYFQQLAEHAQE